MFDPLVGVAPFYQLPGDYFQVNTSLGLDIKNYTINLVVNNLLDRENYQPSSGLSAVPRDIPRSFRLQFSGTF